VLQEAGAYFFAVLNVWQWTKTRRWSTFCKCSTCPRV